MIELPVNKQFANERTQLRYTYLDSEDCYCSNMTATNGTRHVQIYMLAHMSIYASEYLHLYMSGTIGGCPIGAIIVLTFKVGVSELPDRKSVV